MSEALTDAAASWFGMNPDQLAQANMTVGSSGRLRFTFTVEATDEDYLGICDRMLAMREPEPHGSADGQEDQPAFVPMPTLNEVMRDPVAYMDDPRCMELMDRAIKLKSGIRQILLDEFERRSKSVEMPENRIQAKMQEKNEVDLGNGFKITANNATNADIKGHP